MPCFSVQNHEDRRREGCAKHRFTPDHNPMIGASSMAKKPLPSSEVLRQLLRYCPETGILTWRARPVSMFKDRPPYVTAEQACRLWNGSFAGKPALNNLGKRGYLRGSIKPFTVTAHRVAWAIHYGHWPKGTIDHVNGDRTDNRIANLRTVDHAGNSRNTALGRKNKSGVIGVFLHSQTGRWTCQITDKGRRLHLGCFGCITAAAVARKRAEAQLGYHPNHGRQAQ